MKNISFIVPLILLITFSSCGFYKRFTYLQTSLVKPDSVFQVSQSIYKLQPADVVYLNVTNLNSAVAASFNQTLPTGSVNAGTSPTSSFYIIGNSIDREGNINLPIIGKIQVAGLTVDESRNKIQKVAETYITDIRIDVKLVSFKISILGEIARPGQYTIFNDRANIFEAISMGGDITYNGNRRRISIVRTYNNTTKVISVNLTQRDILASQQYYLQPNDIIYVEPFHSTAFRLRFNDYTFLITLLSTTLTTILLIKNFSR
jgi:polysaccharide biosynthesis/export protein